MKLKIPVRRGMFGNPRLQAAWLARLGEDRTAQTGALERLGGAYLGYLCARKARLLRLGGALDIEGLSAYFGYALGRLLDLYAAISGEPAGTASHAGARVGIGRRYLDPPGCDGFRPGSGDNAALGEGTILGTMTAWTVPCLEVHLTVSVDAWRMIEGSPAALADLVECFDIMAPLGVDYRVWFEAPPGQRSFLLTDPAAPPGSGGPTIVGINSAL